MFSRTPDTQQLSGFRYQLSSSVFLDPVQADNALSYYTAKRQSGDSTDYIVCQITQLGGTNART